MTETPPHPPQPPHPEQPRPDSTGWNTDHLKDFRALRRDRFDRHVAGVAGGLGRHLDVDPTILRVLFAVLAFFGGAGIVLYVALWLLVPEEGTEDTVVSTSDSTRNAIIIGVAALAGLLAIGDSWNGFGFPWGLAVAGVVILLVYLGRDGSRAGTPPAPSGAPEPPRSGPTGGPPLPVPHGTGPATAYPLGYNPAHPPPYADTGYNPGYPPEGWRPPAPPAPRKPRRSGPLLFGPTLALLTLALGALGLYDANGGSVVDAAYPALALAVVGAALLVAAFYGRGGGLPFLGVVAAVLLPLTALGGPSFEGDRDVDHRPATVAALDDSISVPAGRVRVDLTGISDLEDLEGRTLDLDVNAGEIVVTVPEGLRVEYRTDIEFGGLIETPDGERDGWGATMRGTLGSAGDPTLVLNADLRFGHIELRQS